METEEGSASKEMEWMQSVEGLMPDHIATIIRSSIGLLSKPVNADCLHACLVLVLRVTRDHQFAAMFSDLGGCKAILNLTQTCSFQGFNALATYIFRHVLEEPEALKQVIHKVTY